MFRKSCARRLNTTLPPQFSRLRAARILVGGLPLLPLAGCGHTDELNLFGAYFPVWLLSIAVGVLVAFACRFLFVRLRLEPYLRPLTMVYVCITVSVACLVWIITA